MKNENRSTHFMLGYGLKNDQLIHISEVESGLECGCICPQCKQKLIARKGEINEHHFAHFDADSCEGAYESTLHKLGKDIIARHKSITLPILEVVASLNDIAGYTHTKKHTNYGQIKCFDQILIEVAEGSFIPDITAIKGNETLFIEIVVSHGIDKVKLAKVKSSGINMISIDLSGLSLLLPLEEIEQAVLHKAHRMWIYEEHENVIQLKLTDELNRELDEINEHIKAEVIGILTPDEIAQLNPNRIRSLKPDNHEHILLGYKSAFGYSTKNKNNFDFSTLYLANKIMPSNGSTHYQERGIGGYELIYMSFEEALLPTLESLEYPSIVSIQFEPLRLPGGKLGLQAVAISPAP